MDFGSFFFMSLIAIAVAVVLGAFALLYMTLRRKPIRPKTRRHYAHTHHQTWWKGLKDARRLLQEEPEQVGDCYFWEDALCTVRLDHEGMKHRYEGNLTIRRKRTDVGGVETIIYQHGRGYGYQPGASGIIYRVAQPCEAVPHWALRDVLWPLYRSATRKALVT
jgi:hypothetical protein